MASDKTIRGKNFYQAFILIGAISFLLIFPSSAFPNGTESLISTDAEHSAQLNPAIYSDMIAWEDWQTLNPNIKVYNLISGVEYTPVPDEFLMQTAPSIFGSIIVWQQFDSNTFEYSIVVYDSDTHTHVSYAANSGADPIYTPEDNCFPQIFDDDIVWQDYNGGDWDIGLYNVMTGVSTIIISGASDQKKPVIQGNFIAYENWTDPAFPEIWLYDLTNASALQITSGSFAVQPDISQNTVVWEELSGSPQSWKIFSYTIQTGIVHQVTPIGATWDQKNPSVNNIRIALEDYRRLGYADIYCYDPSGGSEIWVSPVSLNNHQQIPRIYGDRIVWEDFRSGTSEIYLFTLGSADTCPIADFLPSTNAGASPLSVIFSEHATGSPILFRIWNYSDGTTIYPMDPAGQIFSGMGKYRAILTVGNAKCRNITGAISKYDLYVDTPPEAGFTATPRDGFVPLAVQFTDTSGGEPTTWTWNFGDGSSSHDRNPVHSYISSGQLYSVSLTVNNTFAGMVTDSETKIDYIRTFLGSTGSSATPIPGITVIPRFGGSFLVYNASMLPDMATPLPNVLIAFYPGSAGWSNITFMSADSAGFSDSFGNNTYMGNISHIILQTEDVKTSGSSPDIGTGWGVNYRFNTIHYPSPASISTEIWENTLATDRTLFRQIVTGSNFIERSNGIAYTAHIEKNGIPSYGIATINMSVDRSWIAGLEDQTFVIGYGINGQQDLVGGVIPARYLFNDGVLDYFEADIPDYFTQFGIAPLSGSGNPFQLITLSVASHISPSTDTTGSDDNSVPDDGAAFGKSTAPATVQEVNPPAALAPIEPGKTEKIYSNAQGVITQATVLKSTDERAQLTIGLGVVAKDPAGTPLTSVTLTELPADSRSPVPAVTGYSFAGMAYNLGPDGATFSPAISLSFSIPPEAPLGQEYSVKSLDPQTGTWNDLPTTVDSGTGKITAQISHFCCFALFAKPLASASPAYKAPVSLQTQVPKTTPPPPPATALSIFFGMMTWITELVINNVYILVIVIILGIAYGVKKRKYPGSGR